MYDQTKSIVLHNADICDIADKKESTNKWWYPVVYGTAAGEASPVRRIPNKRDQRYIRYELQDNNCAYCDYPLDDRVHWDHIKPFCVYGNETEYAATHPLCNLLKSASCFDTYAEIRRYVKRQLRRRYEKIKYRRRKDK